MLTEQGTGSWSPASELDRAAVQQQLERLLSTTLFNSSKRYPSFLKFVVDRALAGQLDQLKERILGVEVFGRPADYDTHTDPIVRVTAAEIRKRIEQYYGDVRHADEIRMVLPSGSYIPQFSWPGRPRNSTHAPKELPISPSVTPAAPPAGLVSAHPSRATRYRAWKFAISLSIVGTAAAAAFFWFGRTPVIRAFWNPFIKSSQPVVFCIADQNQYSTIRLRDAADPQREKTLSDRMVTIIIDDASPLADVAGLLRTYGKSYEVLGESTTSLTDLRRGPSVFIGAFDNTWTLRLTSSLPFHFANDPDMNHFWIEDRANPGKREWMLDRGQQQQTGTYKDYAIVARFVEPTTDQYAVVAAGIGRGGTIAAGEFLVDPRRMETMLSQVPRDWERKNLEVVLETQVIEGRSGPPRISAARVW